jgi:hypothetical protein
VSTVYEHFVFIPGTILTDNPGVYMRTSVANLDTLNTL